MAHIERLETLKRGATLRLSVWCGASKAGSSSRCLGVPGWGGHPHGHSRQGSVRWAERTVGLPPTVPKYGNLVTLVSHGALCAGVPVPRWFPLLRQLVFYSAIISQACSKRQGRKPTVATKPAVHVDLRHIQHTILQRTAPAHNQQFLK